MSFLQCVMKRSSLVHVVKVLLHQQLGSVRNSASSAEQTLKLIQERNMYNRMELSARSVLL